MFKLKKIINKHNNAPELEIQEMSSSCIGEPEFVYYLSNGELTNTRPDDDSEILYYLSYAEIGEMDMERSAKCLRITSDMLFEVTCTSDTIPSRGDKFVIVSDFDRSGYNKVKKAESDMSDGYYVNVDDWHKTKKVLVRFHCKQ